MENSLILVAAEPRAKPAGPCRTWREMPITNDIIFRGKDECGRTGWFVRLTVSGLYPRRVGPYQTKTAALDALEEFLADVIVEPFTNLANDSTTTQAYVVEGIPLLNGRCAQKGR